MRNLLNKSTLLAVSLLLSSGLATAENIDSHAVKKVELYECGNRETALAEIGEVLLTGLRGGPNSPEDFVLLQQGAVGFFFINFEDCLCRKDQKNRLDRKAVLACAIGAQVGAKTYFDLMNLPSGDLTAALESIDPEQLADSFTP